jgi:hypothetical protein
VPFTLVVTGDQVRWMLVLAVRVPLRPVGFDGAMTVTACPVAAALAALRMSHLSDAISL